MSLKYIHLCLFQSFYNNGIYDDLHGDRNWQQSKWINPNIHTHTKSGLTVFNIENIL